MKSKILEYVDFEKANTLLEGFNQSTGFVTAIVDLEGNTLSKSGWRQLCTEFHRKNSKTAANCIVSDTELANKVLEGEKFHFYKCRNGLVDVAIPIIIRGEHIANLFTGQFFFEEPDTSFFENQAKRYGFDERSYLKALSEVPVVSKEKVEVAMNFLKDITQMIIEMTAEKMDQLELTETIKASESALLQSQVQLKQTVDDLLESQRLAHLGIWRLNLETDQVVWSDEFYKMYGFDPSIPPPPYTEHMKIFTPKSWEKLSTALELTRITGIPYELELEMATKDASSRWMWVRGEAVKDATGKITELRGAAQDISERKVAHDLLMESEVKFKAVSELSPLAIYASTGSEQKAIFTNKSFHEMFGFSIEDVPTVGHWWIRAFPDEEYRQQVIDRWIDSIDKSNKGNKDVEPLECICTCKDGSEKSIVWVGKTLGNEFWAFGYDLTEEKKFEDELKYMSYHDQLTGLYNRRYFEAELKKLDTDENLPISIIMCDVNRLKLINDSFGHSSGDDVLIKTSKVIKECCRAADVVTRLGGDEFVVILPRTSPEDTNVIMNKIKKVLFKEKVFEINISISMGVDTKTNRGQSIVEILQNAENYMYRHKLYENSSSKSDVINVIMNTLFEKSPRESLHSKRVSEYCEIIATELKLDADQTNKIRIAGLLHDIGKIGINEGILNKPGKLTQAEWKEVKKHPEASWRILSSSLEYSDIARFIYEHHEKLDGSGYPRGLIGDEISIEARIISIADAFDAMTSDRTYRKGLSKTEAIAEFKKYSGTQFDPDILDIFIKVLENG